ncbi:MAG: hypothetical protein N2319_07815 [Candidatus Kapabacteria bacterium]|nr:hypothetical protein [Candidatus Kapabacteria bacterium]
MKRIMIIIILLFASLIQSYGKSIIYIRIDDCEQQSSTDWEWVDNQMVRCADLECNDCRVIIVEKVRQSEIDPLPFGGWTIKTYLDEVTYVHLVNGNPVEQEIRDNNAGFILNESFCMVIVNCPEYPELNNFSINLKNVIVDQNGYINVYIPPLQ